MCLFFEESSTIEVAIVTTTVPDSITLVPNQELFFLTVIRTSLDCENPLVQAQKDYNFFFNMRNQLEYEHIQEWSEIWKSGVEIAGNLEYASAVNMSLYEILSNIRHDWNYSISPGGISTNSYNG